MAKKRSFHCNACKSGCSIYKKGKHRILVCPVCGILATNPLPLLALAASALPSVIQGITKAKKAKTEAAESKGGYQKIVTDNLDLPNKGERYVKMALGG